MRWLLALTGILLMFASGCSQLTDLARHPLPDYWRWKYKEGWHIASPDYSPSTLMALHYTSRERLFTAVYGGYALLDGQLVGIHSYEDGFRAWAPWTIAKGGRLQAPSQKRVYNERNLPKGVVGIYSQADGCIEIRASLLVPPREEGGSTEGPSKAEEASVLLNDRPLHLEVQANKLRIEAPGETPNVVDLPLPGFLQACATQRRADGKEFLLLLLKERSDHRYALIVIDDHFQSLGFYLFPNPIRETPYFVRDSLGELFIVPLNALMSTDEGIFEVEL